MSAYEAVRIRLDPTPRQTRLLESHAGGARFAYNLMLAHVQRQISLGEKPDWTLYAMRRWWNEWKDEIAPWWRENSKEAYSSAFEWLSQALRNWSDSRKGRRAGRRVGWPKYKSKRSSVPRFAYTTGSFDLIKADPIAMDLSPYECERLERFLRDPQKERLLEYDPDDPFYRDMFNRSLIDRDGLTELGRKAMERYVASA